MPGAARIGDNGSGHGCWPPRPSTAGSGDVIVNGIGVVRYGDPYAVHTCVVKPYPSHGGSAEGCSGTVKANGLGIHRIGDAISCGSSCAEGSDNVIVGG